jgi:nucleotide-binding universal stress UspA family protein
MPSTMSHETTADRSSAHAATRKVLIAMYGQESPGWVREVARAVPRSSAVRALLVDPPAPAFTSLVPAARRRLGAAVAASRRDAATRRQTLLDTLMPALPLSAEVVRVPSTGDPGRTIADAASDWPADVVLLGHDDRGRLERALTGSVHERVVRRARCSVLVISADPLANVTRIGRFPLPSRAAIRGGA